MEQESMKPCPLCGGEVRIHRRTDGQVDGIVCDECLLTLEAVDVHPEWHTLDELVRRWNARAERTCRIVWRSDLSYVPEEGGYVDDGQYVCTACGEPLPDCVDHWWDSYQADDYAGEPPFRCCPNCGAKIEGESI